MTYQYYIVKRPRRSITQWATMSKREAFVSREDVRHMMHAGNFVPRFSKDLYAVVLKVSDSTQMPLAVIVGPMDAGAAREYIDKNRDQWESL